MIALDNTRREQIYFLIHKTILGQFISILTFPGIIVHEFSHELFCRFLGVKVKKVCYFRFGNPAGYVMHEASRYFLQAFLIATGPFILGTMLTAASFTVGKQASTSLQYLWIWLGISIAVNCLPSKGDAKSLWFENWSHIKRNPLTILGLPFTASVWTITILDSVWLRCLYASFIFFLTW